MLLVRFVMALVNKAELADLIRCSLPTMAEMRERSAAFTAFKSGAGASGFGVFVDMALWPSC